DLVNEKTNNWINVVSLNQESVIENVGNSFTVNRLLLEDVLNVNQLPKFEDFGEHIFVTLKMIR
ncbi:MAG: magnesium and cobalt transport protein CorA, partial [Balneolaceae bacterium]